VIDLPPCKNGKKRDENSIKCAYGEDSLTYLVTCNLEFSSSMAKYLGNKQREPTPNNKLRISIIVSLVLIVKKRNGE